MSPDALFVIYSIMAERRGYDVSMIRGEMDLEAHLGIDSITRVEILGAAERTLGVRRQKLDALCRARTVGEVDGNIHRQIQEGTLHAQAGAKSHYKSGQNGPIVRKYGGITM